LIFPLLAFHALGRFHSLDEIKVGGAQALEIGRVTFKNYCFHKNKAGSAFHVKIKNTWRAEWRKNRQVKFNQVSQVFEPRGGRGETSFGGCASVSSLGCSSSSRLVSLECE